ncbi:Cyclic di-GMP phosphodiesterase response regulator RpfG [Pigmentiphaga humi]|uniref:Cyclic di-GMP phosphodiesterase response regulator RpfG n=1 Tax=Pigmentiphaga humi TaxID=2478468 RepID=A0A3P4AZT4_9BURK|nr:HD domain-containing phosphohydrolase [Pigmentiphaga humi]VCU68355.1 Cyclic di-GMP phosphodiesterase response regulator RpfG [Pigmentiphaga humi]
MPVPPSTPLSSLPELCHALQERCHHTYDHSGRVGRLAQELGLACGLPQGEILQLRQAASFHDIGKIQVPDDILFKPGRLDAAERDVMMRHAELGEQMFAAAADDNADLAAAAIRHHHESFDGSGYPDGLHGEQIPLLARIVSLADSYDAMASVRPYQHARTHHEIMEILLGERGSKNDPRLFDEFARLMERPDMGVFRGA